MPAPLELELALRFAGAAARARLEPLYAIDAEIAAAARPGVEHAVAHAKLGWWHGEVERLAAGRPEHPLARALHARAGAAPGYARLNERLAAAELALAGFAPATPLELEALLARSHGALQVLAAELLAGGAAPALAAFGAALGRGLGLVEALAAPGAPLLAALERAPLIGAAREALAAATRELAAPLRPAQAHGLVRGALAAARLAALARGATAPPHPFPQLWLAWRTARRARRE
ncbi:MAG TPA: squalene/phytoene synthase family protein [Steroidobacteraceae bacterium]|nr:squalene/phytoene synthase family protein [Steroidobacteraceae bacterium]